MNTKKKLLVSIIIIIIKYVLIFHYNIKADPMLGIGYVAVIWIPCSCSECLSKVSSTFNIRQDR